MTIKTNMGLVAWATAWVGQAYWYGTCGYACTQRLLTRKARQYPKAYSATRMSRYRADIANGKKCADCIGLIKGYYWTRDDGKQAYGLDGRPDQGANGAFHAASVKGAIASLPELPGVLLWKSGHVGVYIGNGEAVEAKGFQYGIVKTKVQGRGWTHWFRSPYIDYRITEAAQGTQPAAPPAPAEEAPPVQEDAENTGTAPYARLLSISPGQPLLRGQDVLAVQAQLLAKGYAPGKPDGIYGKQTEAAVAALQADHGQTPDGVVGPKTRALLW